MPPMELHIEFVKLDALTQTLDGALDKHTLEDEGEVLEDEDYGWHDGSYDTPKGVDARVALLEKIASEWLFEDAASYGPGIYVLRARLRHEEYDEVTHAAVVHTVSASA